MPSKPLIHQDFRHRGWHRRPATSPSAPLSLLSGPTVTDTTQTSLTVTWTCSAVCSGYIEYGTSTGVYTAQTSVQDIEGGYSTHVQLMSPLVGGTTYYFRVRSTDANGNEVISNEASHATVTPPSGNEFEYPTLLSMSLRSLQSVQMPSYLGTRTDPVFGTTVTRVSNVVNQRHRYSAKAAAWSATGKYLLLDYPGSDGNRPLLDGNTYQVIIPHVNTSTHFVWSLTDDSVGWSTSGTTMYRYTFTDTGYSRTSVANLSQFSAVNIGGGEGSPSNDSLYLPLKVSSGSSHGVAIYNTATNSVVAQMLHASAAVNNCTMGPSGGYILIQHSSTGTSTTQGTWAYPRTSLSVGNGVFISNSLSHRDTCRDPSDSFDQVVIPGDNPSGVYAYRLSNGSRIQLCGATNRIHVSGRAHKKPGIAAISHYSVPGEGGDYSWPGYGEVFTLKTDGSEFNQSRPYVQTHRAQSLGYVGEVHGCLSPYGDRVIFATEWASSGGISGGVYAFVAGVTV